MNKQKTCKEKFIAPVPFEVRLEIMMVEILSKLIEVERKVDAMKKEQDFRAMCDENRRWGLSHANVDIE